MSAPEYEVAVVGAGAAGLVAAARAAERGLGVVLLEKNRRPGVKILMSGGTRCNITNARGLNNLQAVSGSIDAGFDQNQARGMNRILDAFGPRGGFLRSALRAFSVDDVVRMFEAEGVATKIEGNGKIFPASDRAVDVLAALQTRLERSGAELRTNAPVISVERLEASGFRVRTSEGFVDARRVILALGGQSYPGCGTRGDGYEIARGFGHTIVSPRPALVPLRVDVEWVTALKGITIPDAVARVRDESGRVVASRREAVLFAHFGLTGPAILDISRAVARCERPQSLKLELDFEPDTALDALDARISEAARKSPGAAIHCVSELLPRRVAEALFAQAGIPQSRRGAELSREERRRLVAALKGTRIAVAGHLGFEKAEVTSGGVSLDEVNPKTLESLRQPGLFLCGEVLDLDGLIGGYNFQAAWSTGWLAGSVV